MRNKEFLFLVVLLVLAFGLRVYKLDSMEYRMDELNLIATSMDQTVSDSLMLRYSGKVLPLASLPVPYLLFKVYIATFGSSEMATRFLSVVFGLVSILIFYKLMDKLASSRFVVFSAMCLFAINSSLIGVSRISRRYSLFIMLGLMSYYYFIRLFYFNDSSVSNKILFIIFSFLMVASGYFTLFIVLSQGLSLLFAKRCMLLRWSLNILPVATLLLPWGIIILTHFPTFLQSGVSSLNWLPPPSYLFAMQAFPFLILGRYFTDWQMLVWNLFLFALLFLGIIKIRKTQRILLGIPILVYTFIVLISPSRFFGVNLVNYDYLIVIIPFLIALLSFGMAWNKRIGIFAFLLLFCLIPFSRHYSGNRQYSDLLEDIFEQEPDSTVLFYPPYYNLYTYIYQPSHHIDSSYNLGLDSYKELICQGNSSWIILANPSKPNLRNATWFEGLCNNFTLKNYNNAQILHFIHNNP